MKEYTYHGSDGVKVEIVPVTKEPAKLHVVGDNEDGTLTINAELVEDRVEVYFRVKNEDGEIHVRFPKIAKPMKAVCENSDNEDGKIYMYAPLPEDQQTVELIVNDCRHDKGVFEVVRT